MHEITAVWCDQVSVCLGDNRAGPAIQHRDPVSGPMRPDAGYAIRHPARTGSTRATTDRTHGMERGNVSTSQTPVPILVGGGSILGPADKLPAQECRGGDVVSSPSRGERYAAIRNIRPETTATIGSVARQSYQYVRPVVAVEYYYNMEDPEGGVTPRSPLGEGGTPRMTLGALIQPALEPPRHSYNTIDTDYLTEQQDLLMTKAILAERQR